MLLYTGEWLLFLETPNFYQWIILWVDACFSIVVVAEKHLYTTTTSGVCWLLHFSFGVGVGLLAGSAINRKQNRQRSLD